MSDALPNDTAAESYLLSCVFIDSASVIGDALAYGITADSFYDSKHAEVFRAMLSLVNDGFSVDVATLHCALNSANKLAEVGGVPALVELSSYIPTTLQTKAFCRRVRDCQIRRDLLRANAGIADAAGTIDGTPAEEVLEDAARKIMDLDSGAMRESWSASVSAALASFECRIDRNRQREADADAVSFGFADLDRVCGKMRLGQVVVLAARPSVGKSSLARQIAMHAALKEDAQVLFASLEVKGTPLAMNMAQTISGVSARELGPQTHPGDVALFRDGLKKIQTKRLEMLSADSVSLAAIRSKAEVLRARGTPVRLVVVDYLQLMPDCSPNKGETRAFSVGRVSRGLKAFALATNSVVLLLSQLNRDSAKEGREPALHDLRESGDIEQDADKVILLHRPPVNPLTKLEQAETSLPADCPRFYVSAIQAKGRDDGTATVALSFRRAITRFEQIQP